MEHDPIEDDPKYQSIFASIDAEVETLLEEKGYTRKGIGMGYCHMFWTAKAEVLKEKYNAVPLT